MPKLTFVFSPARLPDAPKRGRILLVDIAFAYDTEFDQVTRPFIEKLGPRLAGWIDHHDHPAWIDYEQKAHFVLVSKQEAPACPQLVTPELLSRLGRVDHLWAHADFDGLMTAAKVLNEGAAPYPEADEDARSIDHPGQGHPCSERGRRLALALDQAYARSEGLQTLMHEIVDSLLEDREPDALAERIDALAAERRAHEQRLAPLLDQAERVHPEVLVLRSPRGLTKPDKKYLLRELETRARVGVLVEGGWSTAATFFDYGPDGLDLGRIPGLKGQRGYAFGAPDVAELVVDIAEQLDG